MRPPSSSKPRSPTTDAIQSAGPAHAAQALLPRTTPSPRLASPGRGLLRRPGADGASAPSPTSLGRGGSPGRSASGDVVSGARHSRAGRVSALAAERSGRWLARAWHCRRPCRRWSWRPGPSAPTRSGSLRPRAARREEERRREEARCEEARQRRDEEMQAAHVQDYAMDGTESEGTALGEAPARPRRGAVGGRAGTTGGSARRDPRGQRRRAAPGSEGGAGNRARDHRQPREPTARNRRGSRFATSVRSPPTCVESAC